MVSDDIKTENRILDFDKFWWHVKKSPYLNCTSLYTGEIYTNLNLRSETSIPEEIGSTYSYLLCAAIQVWYGIIMLIPRFSWHVEIIKRYSI